MSGRCYSCGEDVVAVANRDAYQLDLDFERLAPVNMNAVHQRSMRQRFCSRACLVKTLRAVADETEAAVLP